MKADRQSRIALAREALRLRRRLLDLLVDAMPEGERDSLGDASTEAWRFLLRAECCALPLGDFLRRRELVHILADPVREALRTAELLETQRVLAARTTLDALDVIGAQLGVPVVALKGGAVVATPGMAPLDLGDVDVLIARSDAERVWDALRDQGWSPALDGIGPGTLTDRNHLYPLVPPGLGLPVELHHRVSYGAQPDRQLETEPIPGRASLRRLAPYDAVVVLLRHSVIAHPYRRGHLRDLFLLASELNRVTAVAQSALQTDLAGDLYAAELRDMLDLALAVRTPRSMSRPTSDRFVAWKYASLLKLDAVVAEVLPGWLSVAQIPLERSEVRRLAVRSQLKDALGPVPPASGFRLAWSRRAPAPLRDVGSWLARAGWRLALLALLPLFGARVRRVVDDLLDSRDR